MSNVRKLAAVSVAMLTALGLFVPTVATAAGTFVDDDGNTHEANIELIAAEGITKGCNPPTNDRYCPDDYVTRGQMAAFLVRALGLKVEPPTDVFSDDDGHTFERDIQKLYFAGITKGCNPPTNDRYCPDDYVTRGQMAAFLVRAFGYTDNGGGNLFVDDDGSTFEDDIDKLGTAGVTKGCNPPTNDRYCPDDYVTRAQMASFLVRALGLPYDDTGTGTTTTTTTTTPGGSTSSTASTTTTVPATTSTTSAAVGWVIHTVDSRVGAGRGTALGVAGGLPTIAFRYDEGNDLSAARCTDIDCSSPGIVDVDTPGLVGKSPAIAILDDTPVISYYDATEGALKVARCFDASCSSSTNTIVEKGSVGEESSIAIVGGLPVISYYDLANDALKVAYCRIPTCSTVDITTVDSAGGNHSSIADVGGLPLISYYVATDGDLRVAACDDVACTTATITTLDSAGDVGDYSSLAVVSGLPTISYYDVTNRDLKVARCTDSACTAATFQVVDSPGDVGQFSSIVEAPDGFGWIAYYDLSLGDLKFADCDDAGCSSALIETVDSVDNTGKWASIAVVSGTPAISYYDSTVDELRYARKS